MADERIRWTTQHSLDDTKAYRPTASTPPLPRSSSMESLHTRSLRNFRVRKSSTLLDVLLVLLPLIAISWRLGLVKKVGNLPLTLQTTNVTQMPTLLFEARKWLEGQRGRAECVGDEWRGLPFSALQAYMRKRFSSRPSFNQELLELEELLRGDKLESWGLNTQYTVNGPWRISTTGKRLPFLCYPHFVFRTRPWEAFLWLSWFVVTLIFVFLRQSERALISHAERIYRQLFAVLRVARTVNPLDAVPELRLLDEKKYQRLYNKLNALRLEDGRAVIIPRGSQHLWSLL